MEPHDDAHFVIPAREDYLSCIHRMLDPAVIEDPTPFQEDVLNWLCRMHAHLAHLGRVARYRALPSEQMVVRTLAAVVDMSDTDWQELLEERLTRPEQTALLRMMEPEDDPPPIAA